MPLILFQDRKRFSEIFLRRTEENVGLMLLLNRSYYVANILFIPSKPLSEAVNKYNGGERG